MNIHLVRFLNECLHIAWHVNYLKYLNKTFSAVIPVFILHVLLFATVLYEVLL